MKNFRLGFLIAALFAGSTLLVACEKKEAAPPPAPRMETPAPALYQTPDQLPEPAEAPAEPMDVAPAEMDASVEADAYEETEEASEETEAPAEMDAPAELPAT